MLKLKLLSSPEQFPYEATSFEVSHRLWNTQTSPDVTGRIGYVSGDGFYVEMICQESSPLCRQHGLQVPVYLDSAMEAFFHFPYSKENSGKDSPYVNLEFNANGALLAQCGMNRIERTFLSQEECLSLCHRTELHDTYWKLEFHLPLTLLNKIYGITGFRPSDTFTCNFYKISEDPAIEHYAAFSPIQSDSPDFHRPEYFALASF